MLKIALVGFSNSGKTRLIRTYLKNPEKAPVTIGHDLHIINHNRHSIYIWDTGGKDFLSMTKLICKDVDLVVMMYDPSMDPFRLITFFVPDKKSLLLANIASCCDYPPEEAADFFKCNYMYVDTSDRDDVLEFFNHIAPLKCCF